VFDAYHSGDYATALREWTPLAEQGDASAQNNLGMIAMDLKAIWEMSEETRGTHVYDAVKNDHGLPHNPFKAAFHPGQSDGSAP